MAKEIIKTQNVKLFSDEERTVEQRVCLNLSDPCGPWLNITHAGSEISLSLENFQNLNNLVNEATIESGLKK